MKNIYKIIPFLLFAIGLSVPNTVLAQCYNSAEAYILPSSITDLDDDDIPDDGTTVEICYVVNGWDAGPNFDWFHGVQVDMPDNGFDLTTVTPTQAPPAEQADVYEAPLFGGGPDYDGIATYIWLYENPDNAITGMAGIPNQDFGWYVDEMIDRDCGGIINGDCISECGEENDEFLNTNQPFDGDGHNNFGLPSSDAASMWACGDPDPPVFFRPRGIPATRWTFCYTVEMDCAGDCNANVPGDITFYSQGDGSTGAWDNADCMDPGTVISFGDLLAGCAPTIDATSNDVAYCFGDAPGVIGTDAGIVINSFDAGPNASANAGVLFVEICGAWDSVNFPDPSDDPNATGFVVSDAYTYFPGQSNGTDGEGTNCDFITLVPKTFIDVSSSPSISDPNCFAVGTPFVIDYRPEITAAGNYECGAGGITLLVSGGANGDTNNPVAGGYDVTGDLNGITSAGSVTFSDLAEGTYDIIISDAGGCEQAFQINVPNCCSAVGGTITTTDETTICVGDGVADPIDVALTGEAGMNLQWVITDDLGNILDLPVGPPFDLDGADVGTCLIWALSFDDGLTGAAIGNNATTDLVGCFALSNSIAVVREECCPAIGGTISTTDATTICAGDGVADPITVALTGEVGTNQAWVITDANGEILDLPVGPTFDLDGAGGGQCLIWSLSYEDGITGAVVGNNANTDLGGCFALSNPITVDRLAPDGGTISTLDNTTICAGDGVADPINVSVADATGANQAWVITDEDGNILDLPAGPPFNLDGAGAGVCLIWNLAYEDGLTGAAVGNNATTDLVGCYSLSNSIAVTRTTLSASAVATAVNCAGGADGSIDLTVTGDAGGYTFLWNNAEITEDISGLTTGDYDVVVTDANGCTTTASVNVPDGNDTTPPVLDCPGIISFALGAGECDAWVMYNITATDDCDDNLGDPVQTDASGLTSGDNFPIGTTTISYEIADASGNTATCSFDVVVVEYQVTQNAMACNDLINVSLNSECEALITPDMILEGSYGCSDDFLVEVFESDHLSESPIDGSPQVTGEYVDQTLIATVTNLETGIMCWGEINIENKNTPELECPDATGIFCTTSTTPVFPDDYPTASVSCCDLNADNFSYTDGPAGGSTATGFTGIFAPQNWIQQVTDPTGTITFSSDGSAVTLVSPNPNDFSFEQENTVLAIEAPIDGTVAFDWLFEHTDAGFEIFVTIIDDNGNATTVVEEEDPGTGSESFAIEAGNTLIFAAISTDGITPIGNVTISNFQYTVANGVAMDDDCEGVILRSWTVTGCNGMQATCDQIIIRTRPSLSDIEYPDDVTLECGDAYDPTDLTGIITGGTYDEDYPNVDGNDLAELNCNLAATYVDQMVEVCAGSRKILRTWTTADWCTGETETDVQIIKILDTEAPIITCPDHVSVGVGNDCFATLSVPQPTLLDDGCEGSEVTYTVSSTGGVVNHYGGTNWLITQLPLGDYTVTYTAEDGCGNTSECSIFIWVKDLSPPIPVCDEFTSVALGANGTARVYAETFDDGSHDNCGDVYFKVRRMNIGECSQLNGDDNPANAPYQEWFDDYADFCCDDITDGPIMVIMRVYDVDPGPGPIVDNRHNEGGSLYGRYNDCMVEVEVEDKLDPHITCPPDITISCDYVFDENDLSIFGSVVTDQSDRESIIINDPGNNTVPQPYNWGLDGYGADNCDVVVTETSNITVECGNGLITRAFTATDPGGRTATCVQRITIQNFDPFDQNDISWPSDKDADCSQGIDTDATGEPGINTDHCDNVFVGYDDLELPIEYPFCYKILRTWVVIDWCQYEPNIANSTGRWEHVQVIKVLDESAPIVTAPADITIMSTEDNCSSGPVTLDLAIASDNCDANVTITNNYNGGGADASGTYSYGTTTVVFTAEDACGNVSTDEMTVTVLDGKEPTPVCQFIASALMPSSCQLTIWANDFEADGSSFDNCTAFEDLEFRIRKVGQFDAPNNTVPGPSETSVTFDGTEIGQQWVDMWVIDEAGNADHCRTYIVVQDPMSICGGDPDPTIEIAGRIFNEEDEGVKDVEIMIDGGLELPTTFTDGNGEYTIDAPTNANYTVDPFKDVNPLNGVSTYDIVLITKHILGLSTLDSPYKIIAADVNQSGSVTAFDNVQLRKLILHIDVEFSNNDSWRFVDANYNFPMPTDPFAFPFPEVISFNDLQDNELNVDFVGVKIGDVDNSHNASNLLGTENRQKNGNLVFSIEDQKVKAGEEVTVEFKAKDFNEMVGYQFTLDFDEDQLEFVDVAKGDTDNFGLSLLNEGVITSSWHNMDAVTMKDDELVFSLTFKATTDVQLSNALNINSRYTAAEAYTETKDGVNFMDVAFEFNTEAGAVVVGGEFELYQNRPNPFAGQTTIGFTLPEASKAMLTVYDVSGKVLKQVNSSYAQGYNEINIDRDELAGSGLLYYRLETRDYTSTKKMILLK